jgi:transcriptional regulator with XRE-family HTH domain
MDNTFGERLRELRKKRRMNRDDLGQILGVSGNAVTAYETGKRNPRKAVIDQICDYFGVRYDWMTGASEYRTDDEYIRAMVESSGEDFADEHEGRILRSDEMKLVRAYRELSDEGKRSAMDFVFYLKKKP